MKAHIHRLIAVLVVAQLLQTAGAGVPQSQPAAESKFSAEAYLNHIKVLASDELQGRLPGTEGIEQAAQYITKQFADIGLKPAGDDGTWFQGFEVRRGKKLIDAEALLKAEGCEQTWRVREDWIPLPYTEMVDVEAPLAFAGYGIKAPTSDYNDYADFDAEGKALLILRYEPRSDDPNADFGGAVPSRHATFARKARVADREGARALLIVNPPNRPGAGDELYNFSEDATHRTFDIPIVHVSQKVADALLKQAGMPSLKTLQQKLDSERQSLSADMKINLALKTGVKPNTVATRNILGRLPGDGTTDETIILGAHYDHLGFVPRQFDRTDNTRYIHNGADDNASGTAAVIELARALSHENGLHRNILFICFSAEEMGLLGSHHYTAHPTIDLATVSAMINIDMIGRLSRDRFTVFGIPSATEFSDIVSRAAERVGITYRAPKGLSGNSDHAGFFDHGIPYLFPFTGVHKQYHRPEDDWDLIDAPGATKILSMFHQVLRELASMEEGPTFQRPTQWYELEPEDQQMKPAIEHQKEAQEPAGADPNRLRTDPRRPNRPNVRLGIIPDHVESDAPGLIADSVIPGGAAKAAGMRDGDRIIQIGETKIRDIYAYMDSLRDLKPGSTVDVIVIRDGKEITLKVKLQKTRRRPEQD